MDKDIEEFLKELEKADERFQKEKELYKDELMEEDESFHVSHAEAYVIQDEKLLGMDGEDRYKKIDEFLWTYADEVPKE